MLRAGVQLGVLKGKVFVPDHALAMALSPACVLPSLVLDVYKRQSLALSSRQRSCTDGSPEGSTCAPSTMMLS